MQDISIRVMNMVRRTLLESPGVNDRALYAAAVALDPSIGDLTLQQFQARYPRHVRRFELGRRPARKPDTTSARTDDLPVSDRPDLYAPGRDTLIQEAAPTTERVTGESVADEQEARPGPIVRGTRRRAAGVMIDSASGDDEAERTGPLPPASEPEDGSVADVTPAPEAASLPPWPLRLQPDAARLEPPKRLRLLRPALDSARDLRVTRRRGDSDPYVATLPFAGSRRPASGAEEGSGRSGAASAALKPGHLATSGERAEKDPVVRSRNEIRRLLFAWAHELETAETSAALVGVLARAGEYVDLIENALTLPDEQMQRAADAGSRLRTGSTDRDTPASDVTQRPPRPDIRMRKRIQDYSAGELDSLVRWVAGNDRQRTDDETVDAVFAELGFKRRGRRISAVIRSTLERVRARDSASGGSRTG